MFFLLLAAWDSCSALRFATHPLFTLPEFESWLPRVLSLVCHSSLLLLYNQPPQNWVLKQHHLFCSQICNLGRAQRDSFSLLHLASSIVTQRLGAGTIHSLLCSHVWQFMLALGWELSWGCQRGCPRMAHFLWVFHTVVVCCWRVQAGFPCILSTLMGTVRRLVSSGILVFPVW